MINPPELDVLERSSKQFKHGRAIVTPYSDQTVGHGSQPKAVLLEVGFGGIIAADE